MGVTSLVVGVANPAKPNVTERLEFTVDSGAVYSVVPAAVLPESRQRGAPVVQSVMPVLQGEPGFVVHASPAMHITHCPLPLHTMPEPHAAPAR